MSEVDRSLSKYVNSWTVPLKQIEFQHVQNCLLRVLNLTAETCKNDLSNVNATTLLAIAKDVKMIAILNVKSDIVALNALTVLNDWYENEVPIKVIDGIFTYFHC
jgi:hypothetical protein